MVKTRVGQSWDLLRGPRNPDHKLALLVGNWHAHVLDARFQTQDSSDGIAGIGYQDREIRGGIRASVEEISGESVNEVKLVGVAHLPIEHKFKYQAAAQVTLTSYDLPFKQTAMLMLEPSMDASSISGDSVEHTSTTSSRRSAHASGQALKMSSEKVFTNLNSYAKSTWGGSSPLCGDANPLVVFPELIVAI